MIRRIARPAVAAGATLAIAVAIGAVVFNPAAATTASAAQSHPTTTTVSDYWEQTHHNIDISSRGGAETPIMTLRIPAGDWVLHADQTIVNFGPSDFAGCSIVDSAIGYLNTHRTLVGDPTATGAWGSASLVTVLSETAAVSTGKASTITIRCEHDHTNGSIPYIDANADLWAHRTLSRVVITQLP